MQNIIKIHPNDNVAVALKTIEKETILTVGEDEITIKEEIPQGHKFSIKDINSNESVIKYGFCIGNR